MQPEVKVDKKKDVKILYIEADEDHVALQNKSKNEDDNNSPKIAMPKLIYVHEGFDYEKGSKKEEY